MLGVAKGMHVYLDYTTMLDLMTGNFLSRPNGKLLVHYTGELVTHINGGYEAVGFYPLSPWRKRFDQYLVWQKYQIVKQKLPKKRCNSSLQIRFKEEGLDKIWKRKYIRIISNIYKKKYDVSLEIKWSKERNENVISLTMVSAVLIAYVAGNVVALLAMVRFNLLNLPWFSWISCIHSLLRHLEENCAVGLQYRPCHKWHLRNIIEATQTPKLEMDQIVWSTKKCVSIKVENRLTQHRNKARVVLFEFFHGFHAELLGEAAVAKNWKISKIIGCEL